MHKLAIFPGTFDPITNGHVDIVKRGLHLFDEIIIAVGQNTKKQTLFATEKRVEWIENIFANDPRVKVSSYEGLTVDFCKHNNALFILRGLRSNGDFEYESYIAQVNRKLAPGIETTFIMSSPELTSVSSSVVRDVIVFGGDYKSFVPKEVLP